MNGEAPGWIKDFDLVRARRNLFVEFNGDWFRDPWGWPEIMWLTEGPGAAHVAARIRADDACRGYALDVPKENFGTRPACILHPLDRLAYQVVVDFLSVRLAGNLPSFVCGWRLRRDAPEPGVYAHNGFEWRNHRRHLVEFSRRYEKALTTDIVSYFASIDLSRLTDVVARATRSSRAQRRLLAYFDTFEQATDRKGLPQRSFASSLLANAYLAPLDDLLMARSQPVRRAHRPSTHSVARWMDDIWLFGEDEGALRKAQIEIEAVLLELGLVMNSAKTVILEGDDLQNRARQREHSGVEAQLKNSGGDELSALLELVGRILAAPEQVDRTTYRFVLARVEEFGLIDVARELAAVAHRAPHAADSLADAFRRLDLWRDMSDWYLEYRRSPWLRNLACAHFGRMFPRTDALGDGRVVEALEEDCSTADLPRATVALTRLVAWDAGAARPVIREAARHLDHPLLRRSFALAAIAAGEERALIRRLLRSHRENAPLLEMIEERHFSPFRVPRSF
jgi:Reverse transcriptase (RNA-dependent DNA polymerase)